MPDSGPEPFKNCPKVQRVQVLPPQQALTTLRGTLPRCSQKTLTIRLGLPGLTGILPHHWTRWWSIESAAPLFTWVSRTCGCKSNNTTKLIIELQPKVSCARCPWTPLCLNRVYVMESYDEHRSPATDHRSWSGQGSICPNHAPPGPAVTAVSPLTFRNSTAEESPTSLKGADSRALAVRRGEADYLVGTSQPCAPVPAPSLSERWHFTCLTLANPFKHNSRVIRTLWGERQSKENKTQKFVGCRLLLHGVQGKAHGPCER